MKDNKHNIEYFLEELTRLTMETGIAIGGCGCCGSPWIEETLDSKGKYLFNKEDESFYTALRFCCEK